MPAHSQARPFNVDDYYAMARAGVLRPDECLELIDGRVLVKPSISSARAGTINRLNRCLAMTLGERAIVSVQNPVRLDDFNEPEPDLAVLNPRDDFYAEAHPSASDVLLLIEVSDSSLVFDRKIKLPLYASHGISEVWVVNLIEGVIEVFRELSGRTYGTSLRLSRADELACESVPGLKISVDDVLG